MYVLEFFHKRLATNRIAPKDVKNTLHIQKIRSRDKVHLTKIHYISNLRNWSKYCALIDEDPFNMPMDPLTVTYWFSEREHSN